MYIRMVFSEKKMLLKIGGYLDNQAELTENNQKTYDNSENTRRI
jgi:hypothetical protein